MRFNSDPAVCSFCARLETPGAKLAAGLGAMICDGCVQTLYKCRGEGDRWLRAATPLWVGMPVSELLGNLPLLARSCKQSAQSELEWVSILRERDVSWTQIGETLGISGESARLKYEPRAAGTRE